MPWKKRKKKKWPGSPTGEKWMRRRLVVAVAAVAGGTFGAHLAQAQSSVELYGSVDGGLGYLHDVAAADGSPVSSQVRFTNGLLHGNRWGLRGSEDLGGGSKAIFLLENGFDLGTGQFNQGGREFGRQAFMGLTSTTMGSLLLGRQYDPNVDLILPLTADAMFGKSFGTPGDIDNYDDTVRVSNSIKYVSPKYGGFTYEAMYGFGGVAGSTGAGQTYGAGVVFERGPFAAAAAYYHANGGNTVVNGVRVWTSSSDSFFNSVINQGYASAESISISRVGMRYAKNALTVGVTYSNVQYAADASSAFARTENFNVVTAFTEYKLTRAGVAVLGYIFTKSSGDASATYNQVNIGYDYSLSKSTELYALAGWQKASGTTLNPNGKIVAANASIGSFDVNSGTDKQGLVAIGMRHRF
jgi:predicted porin